MLETMEIDLETSIFTLPEEVRRAVAMAIDPTAAWPPAHPEAPRARPILEELSQDEDALTRFVKAYHANAATIRSPGASFENVIDYHAIYAARRIRS